MRSPSTDISYTLVADGNILRARLTPGPGKTLISLPFSMFYTHPALVSRSFLLEATQIRLSCAQSCWAYRRSRVFTAHLFGIARLNYKGLSGGAFVPFPFLMRVCRCHSRTWTFFMQCSLCPSLAHLGPSSEPRQSTCLSQGWRRMWGYHF